MQNMKTTYILGVTELFQRETEQEKTPIDRPYTRKHQMGMYKK